MPRLRAWDAVCHDFTGQLRRLADLLDRSVDTTGVVAAHDTDTYTAFLGAKGRLAAHGRNPYEAVRALLEQVDRSKVLLYRDQTPELHQAIDLMAELYALAGGQWWDAP